MAMKCAPRREGDEMACPCGRRWGMDESKPECAYSIERTKDWQARAVAATSSISIKAAPISL